MYLLLILFQIIEMFHLNIYLMKYYYVENRFLHMYDLLNEYIVFDHTEEFHLYDNVMMVDS